MYFVVCVPDSKQNPPQSSAWQVQSLDASYGNKELNHESDVQQQQHPQHMSITAHMALCMTAAPKSRRQIKAPARRKTDICHRDETEPTIRKLSLSFTHDIDQRMDSISYVSNVLCLAVFSHYLPLALHRDFLFFLPSCQFSLAFWPSNVQHAEGIWLVCSSAFVWPLRTRMKRRKTRRACWGVVRSTPAVFTSRLTQKSRKR